MKLDLSELPITPSQYRVAGIAMLASGVVLLILALVFALNTQMQQKGGVLHTKAVADECISRISQLGLKATAQDNRITVSEPNPSQTVELLAASSQAIGLCPEWSLSQYCLGSGCKPPGLTMVLQYNESQH